MQCVCTGGCVCLYVSLLRERTQIVSSRFGVTLEPIGKHIGNKIPYGVWAPL